MPEINAILKVLINVHQALFIKKFQTASQHQHISKSVLEDTEKWITVLVL